MKNSIIIVLFFLSLQSFSQKIQTKLGPGIDLKNEDVNSIFNLWKNYLSSNPDLIYDNPNWNDSEKKKYKSYDLLKSEGFLNPSIYALQPLNTVLYINEFGNDYIIHSMYYWINEDNTLNPLAITNVVAKKENGVFKLYNYLPFYTNVWKSKQVGMINYNYPNDYIFDNENAQKADKLLHKLNELFDLDLKNLTYYIARDCDEIHKMKGFEYIISMGRTPSLCRFYDTQNSIVYSSSKIGEYDMHELIHVINAKYTKAHYLLLSGLATYTNDKSASFGKPFLYYIDRIQNYIDANLGIDLADFEKLPQIDEIDAYYFVGALITDIILEKGGIDLLKEALNSGVEDKDLLQFLEKKVGLNKQKLDSLLKNKFKKASQNQNFTFRINY
ncbi:hypothetical protein [Flavobacterium limnophilum]|uniref:hypothetical protein n=1 Tax=Flavobacterium limnophilum TaxID=3003262 RepID=UPI002483132A|nr:hypothetical protein [Flavobacterium limnophilum]